MKSFYTIFFLMLTLTGLSAQDVSFLEGTWKVADQEIYEQWTKAGDKGFIGRGYTITNGVEKITEALIINKIDGKWAYHATVANQNNGNAVVFLQNTAVKNALSFENPQHDFPKKIVYTKISDSQFLVEVSGDAGKGFGLIFDRQ